MWSLRQDVAHELTRVPPVRVENLGERRRRITLSLLACRRVHLFLREEVVADQDRNEVLVDRGWRQQHGLDLFHAVVDRRGALDLLTLRHSYGRSRSLSRQRSERLVDRHGLRSLDD